MRVNIDHSVGDIVYVTASSPNILGVDLNTSGGILQGRATILCSYKVSP